MADSIQEVQATGQDIEAIISELEPILMPKPRTHVLMACLAIAFMVTDPDIDTVRLVQGVKEASQWICMYTAGADVGAVTDPSKIN